MAYLHMRELLKRQAEPILATLAWRLRPRSARNRTLILAYHNVRPAGASPAGATSLHIRWERFVQHLDLIAEHADIVSLEDAARSAAPHSRLRVALTFDDAYTAAVELALPEIARRGHPATMFVAPALLDGQSSWWDQLAHPLGGELSEAMRQTALEVLAGQQERVRSWAATMRHPWAEHMPTWATGATTKSLIRASTLPGIGIEAHSWSHPNLAMLGGAQLVYELVAVRDWLLKHGLGRATWLAYPYGMFTSGTMAAAASAGYAGAFAISGGFLSNASDPFQLPRLNVPAGLSCAGLKLRLSQWLTN